MAPVAFIHRARTALAGAGCLSLLLVLCFALIGCTQPQTPPQADPPAPPAQPAAAAPVEAHGPRCVIVLIGDGMGFEQVKAASLYGYGREDALAMQQMPYQGQATTYPAGGPDRVTDSAASGTALATGHKVDNGVISVALPGDGQPLTTALELYSRQGRMTGLITTTNIADATPAVFAAHVTSRKLFDEIADCYFKDARPNLLLGDISPMRDGQRAGVTAEKAQAAGYMVLRDRPDLTNAPAQPDVFLSGQFHGLPYMYDQATGKTAGTDGLPTLSEMTARALAILDTDPDGMFLMVEGAKIDHAGHGNSLERNVFETLEFDRAVATVLRWAAGRDDVLVIVTADHETGGLKVVADRDIGRMPEVTWSTKGHSGTPVPVFAQGPGAEAVVGMLDNTDIFRLAIGDRPAATQDVPSAAAAERVGAAAD